MPPKMSYESDDECADLVNESAMQKYLDLDYSKNFMAGLPKEIRQRAEVLLKYHEDAQKLQREMEAKEMDLHRKYDILYEPILKRRTEIVNGTGAEVSEEEVQRGVPMEHEGQVSTAGPMDDEKGLPGFWLQVLHHHVALSSLIEEKDEEALNHLIDISTRTGDGDYGSFDVVFTFSPNNFFEEEKLTLTLLVDKASGPQIRRSPITWKAGKNLTVEKVTKKQKAKKTKQVRVIEREVPCESFFTIFQEKEADEEDDNGEDDTEEQIISLLQILHNSVVPCAVRHYTGEAPDGSSDIEEEEEGDDDDDDEDEDY